jgi:hypothetical protein
VKAPRVLQDQIQPFLPDQVQALVDAARRNRYSHRDVAIILLLVDTGPRISTENQVSILTANQPVCIL